MPGVRASVAGGQRQQAVTVRGVDGRDYSPAVEEKLNRLAHLVLNNPNGQEFLAYLKSITINSPFDHNVTDQQLRHHEGQRFIVGVLINRAREGAKE